MLQNKIVIIMLGIIVCFLLLVNYTNAGNLNLNNAFDTSREFPFGKAVAAYNPAASPVSIIGLVIRTILSILGVFFIGLMIYGGYLWMTAMGKEQQVTKSKDLITAALIGLIIIVSAYAISYFVTKMFTEEALTPTGGTNQVQTPTGPLPEPIDRPFGTGPGL